ncbi:MAG: hypothetical protein ACFFCP_11275 [Promethearchaeota archaeon]
MPEEVHIEILCKSIVSLAYLELLQREVSVSWRKMSSFAEVHWMHDDSEIKIGVNHCVKKWHQSGKIGLLSHELSHPSLGGTGFTEKRTDLDVIRRGLGTYLAVERLLSGKYDDHIIGKKDRYLGYRTIRKHLTSYELQQLDQLMSSMRLKPISTKASLVSHDTVLFGNKGKSEVYIEGHKFLIPDTMEDPDIKIVSRQGSVLVYADEVIIGEYKEDS